MRSILTGINTGVIRHGEQFTALALKINQQHEQLLLIPALPLRDLFICFEYRLHLQSLRNAKDKAAFKKRQEIATAQMHKHIPPLTQRELLEAGLHQRVSKIEPNNKHKNELQLTITLQGGNTISLLVDDAKSRYLSALFPTPSITRACIRCRYACHRCWTFYRCTMPR